MNDEFEIFAFRAADQPALCEAYLQGHQKVLSDFGIENVTSGKPNWLNNPNMYCLMLRAMDSKELFGGIRVQIADGSFPLPVEDAISYVEPRIKNVVHQFALDGGVGELCGLWVNNELKGLGMGTYLVRAAIAAANQLKFRTMIGICAKYSLQMFMNVGFTIDRSLGKEGDFSYPNDRYVAHVVGILNALTLNTSHPHDKKIMLSLRNEPLQSRVESDTGKSVRIHYNLVYPKVVETKYSLNLNTGKERSTI